MKDCLWNSTERWYFADCKEGRNRLASFFLAGFQHCSCGFRSGEYDGKNANLNVFLCVFKNLSTIFPWWQGPLSVNNSTLPQRFNSLVVNRTKSLCFFRSENWNANEYLLLAPNTFVHTFLLFIVTTGRLPFLAQPLLIIGNRPKVASSSQPITKPFCR